jgi:hypothetical protein
LVALTAFFAGFFAATSGVSSVPSNELRGVLRGCRNSLQKSGQPELGSRPGKAMRLSSVLAARPRFWTLLLESALLYPAPATAATAFRLRFFRT